MMGHTNIKTTQIYAKITKEKISQDMVQKSRDEILSAGSKDILLCADIFDDAMNNAASVTIGSKSIIENSGSYYDSIRNLIAGEIL